MDPNPLKPKHKKLLSWILIILAIPLALPIAVLFLVQSKNLAAGTIDTHIVKSDGLEKDKSIYFILGYHVKKPNKVIFPFPFTFPGKVHISETYLYAFSRQGNSLEQLCKLTPPPGGWYNSPRVFWGSEGDSILFAYQNGNSGGEHKYELYSFLDNNCRQVGTVTEETAMKLTADSPGNQLKIGSIEVDSLTALLPFEKWELTSPLKFFKGSSQKYQNVIIEGVGDRLFQNLVFDRLKDTLSSKDMYKLSEKIEVNYLSLKKHKQIPLACHYVEWKTRAQLHAKYGIKENGNKVEQILGHLYRQENEEANTLLSSHNNANAGDNQGTTLLMGASYADNAKAVESLIQLGAKLDLKDSLGCTALMYAIFGGAPNTMKVLIKSGADTKTTTDVGTSPWLHVCSSPLRQRYLDLTK